MKPFVRKIIPFSFVLFSILLFVVSILFYQDYLLKQFFLENHYASYQVMSFLEKKASYSHLKVYMNQFSFRRRNSPIFLSVPLIDQRKEFPNGCEATSAVMLLQYWGHNISVGHFIDDYLDKQEMGRKKEVRYGPNPMEKYAGDPRSKKEGFGCFSPVIEKALNRVIFKDYMVLNVTGYSLTQLNHIFLSRYIPVMIWATVDMKEIRKIVQWKHFEKEEYYLYPANEHVLVLVGADDDFYYFNDPLHGEDVVFYPKDDVSNRYQDLGKQAIVIIPKNFMLLP